VPLAEGPPQVAYAVGRRIGNAVTRNRLRRRLRAAVQVCAGELRPATAYLVGADPAASRASWDELTRDLGACLGSR
jgi:ribonuclease P protein component